MKKKDSKPLGLYIHIPFCKAKCAYCDFYSLAQSEDKMDAYVAALTAHLEEVAPRAQSHTVDSVYFGGGTPSYLGHKRIIKLLKTIKKQYHVADDAEITMEANPDSANDVHALKALRRAGINRISLGVQSSDDTMLKEIGRIHNWEQVNTAVAAIRKAKITNLSLDLIYGLPNQTMESWQKTLTDCIALEPEHISCYALKVEEGTPLYMRRHTISLPDDDLQADMYLYTVEQLARSGYAQYEISNFAKPDFASRHNLKYWQLQEYAGFGPGAHSDFGGTRYGYVRDLESYLRGDLTLSESEEIPPLERELEYIMLSLRTTEGISRHTYEYRYRQPFAPMETLFEQYASHNLARRTESGWALTPQGFLVSNQIIADLQEAVGEEKTRRIAKAARGDFRVV